MEKKKLDRILKFVRENLDEDAPTMAMGNGAIAGSAEAGDDPPVGKRKKKKYIYQKGLRKWWKQNIDGDGR